MVVKTIGRQISYIPYDSTCFVPCSVFRVALNKHKLQISLHSDLCKFLTLGWILERSFWISHCKIQKKRALLFPKLRELISSTTLRKKWGKYIPQNGFHLIRDFFMVYKLNFDEPCFVYSLLSSIVQRRNQNLVKHLRRSFMRKYLTAENL